MSIDGVDILLEFRFKLEIVLWIRMSVGLLTVSVCLLASGGVV